MKCDLLCKAIAFLTLGFAAGGVNAVPICVGTENELTAALLTAQQSNDSYEIRIRQGYYLVPGGGWSMNWTGGNNSLSIVGGYTDVSCNETPSSEASLTVLDGQGVARPLTINTPGFAGFTQGQIVIKGLTFQNGSAQKAGGLAVSDPGPIYGGSILIENNIFREALNKPPVL